MTIQNPAGRQPLEFLAVRSPVMVLTDAATITWDLLQGSTAKVTLAGNRTLSLSNVTAGTFGTLEVVQDATGGRTLTNSLNSQTFSLNSAPNAAAILSFFFDGSAYFWSSPITTTTIGNSIINAADAAAVRSLLGIQQNLIIPTGSTLLSPVTLTGSTTETTLWSFTIPANTVTPGTVIEFFMQGTCTANANTKTIRMRDPNNVNLHTNNLATATQTAFTNSRRIIVFDSSNYKSINPGAGVMDTSTVNSPMNTYPANFTTDLTFNVRGVLTNATDSIVLEHAFMRIYKP